MSTLLPQDQLSLQDRDHKSFRESPQHGTQNPARAVIVENDLSDPIPVNIVDGEPGTPKHFTSGELSTDGTLQTLISETVPASKIYDLYSVRVICRTHGKFIILQNGSLIGSGRTGPSLGELSVFQWTPRFPAVAADVIEVKFQTLSGAPINEVEAYLQVSERSA